MMTDIEDKKIQGNLLLKLKYKQIYSKNWEIMVDTTTKLKELCEMIELNLQKFENDAS